MRGKVVYREMHILVSRVTKSKETIFAFIIPSSMNNHPEANFVFIHKLRSHQIIYEHKSLFHYWFSSKYPKHSAYDSMQELKKVIKLSLWTKKGKLHLTALSHYNQKYDILL